MVDIRDVEVIALNFKRRLSGVTSTIVQLVPCQADLGLRIATLGVGLPDSLPKIAWRSLWRLWSPPPGRSHRIWHARRNNEMAVGVLLRDGLRMPLKLVFTSAAQRRHTAYTRFLIRRMDAVIATSGRSGAFLDVAHRVIRHGVDVARFRAAAQSQPEDAGDAPLLVGCFGRVRHQKGTDLFVRAMIELLPHHPQWRAVVCGRVTAKEARFGETLTEAVSKAGLTDRIRFPGEVDDITPWYRRLTLYVAPSRNEGFGLTPLEAMASGVAVVASDAGAYAEMVVPGETGAVVPAGDYEALRDALALYLADPVAARRAGEAGLARVSADFALAGEARAVNDVYATLLDPYTRGAEA
ncbi:glycosyltransferase family 4 protein [Ensifer soli]|uniref:glycosyltransferase family 4 protein n=1 Tax=Ciceribacter sp. sgz301302 TaxID=3342379 RepID=UPI0035BA7A55